jgi:2-isopropylmalate synthase
MLNDLNSRPLAIFDTSLRDGEQAPGNAMSIQQKVSIARDLEALGVNTIEAGFPAASDDDLAAVQTIAEEVRGCKICAFARATHSDIECAARALENAGSAQIEILGAASDIHLRFKRQISREQAIDEIGAAVEFARRVGFEDICVAPEDASRADPEFLGLMCQVSAEAGATSIVIPDTVGCLLPSRVPALIDTIRRHVPADFRLSMHAHDDLGLAAANTLAAIEAGVDEIQVTLCGIGERSGNCALEEIVAALVAFPEHFGRTITVDPGRLYAVCRRLIEQIKAPIARAKAIVGENAFATAAGLHQAGIIRNPTTYEFMEPGTFGAERRMVMSRHSGRHALVAKLERFDVPTTPALVEHIYKVLTASNEPTWSDSKLRALALQAVEEMSVRCGAGSFTANNAGEMV